MSIWERIKNFLKGNQAKQIEAPSEERKENSYLQSLQVKPETIEANKARQQAQKDRQFQLGFALRNVCGKGANLFGDDLQSVLLNKLRDYGYDYDKIVLDKMDLTILSKANIDMNLHGQEASQVLEYIGRSKVPMEVSEKLVDRVRQRAITEAAKYQYLPEAADGFVTNNILAEFQSGIQEMERETQQREG